MHIHASELSAELWQDEGGAGSRVKLANTLLEHFIFCTIALTLCIIQNTSEVKKIIRILFLIRKRHGYVYLKRIRVLSLAYASFWFVIFFLVPHSDEEAHDILFFAQKSSFR